MKKYAKFWSMFLVIMITAVISVGCGSGSKSDSASSATDEMYSSETADGIFNEVYDSETSASSTETEDVTENRKIIERLTFSLQTKEFDTLIQNIETKVKEAGGYIETSSVDGKELEYENNRYAELVIRIPSEKSDEFSTYIAENSTVINKEVNTEDVTLSYVDMESRVSALNTEKASLENLLANAQTISDIITIQDRLTEVIYEMESYESQLRTYDNLIDYTTITIYVDEVERTQIVEEQTIWEEIGTNLVNNVELIGDFFVELFVVVASGLPFLIIIAIVVIVIIVIVKKSTKKTQKKAVQTSQSPLNPYGFKPETNVENNAVQQKENI